MSIWTLAEARECAELYKQAIRDAAKNKSYTMEIGGENVSVERQSLPELRRQLSYFQQVIRDLENSGAPQQTGQAVFYTDNDDTGLRRGDRFDKY